MEILEIFERAHHTSFGALSAANTFLSFMQIQFLNDNVIS